MDDKQKDEYIAQLESIIAMMPGNVYWKDKDGKYLGCNDNILKTAKLNSRSDFIGKSLSELIDKEIAEPLLAADKEVFETGLEKCLEEIGPDINGNQAIFLTKKAPLRNSFGEIIGLVGISFDISERKKIEDELKNAREQLEIINNEKTKFIDGMSYLENVLAVIPGNVYWKDRAGKYLGCNDNMARILNLPSRYDIRGKTLFTLAPTKELASTIDKYDENIMLTNQEKTIEEFAHDADGQPATYLTRKVPLHNEEGKVIGMLGISLDITERKKLENDLIEAKDRAEAANKAKSEFLAMISHELRIPLTGMLGMAQLMQSDDGLLEIHREAAYDIIKSGDHLLALVDDLLDISKLEANKMQLNLAAMDLKNLIEKVVSMLLSKAKQKNLELQIHYEENTPHLIYSDSRALQQILLNLIGNAIKFTKAGHIFIKVTYVSQLPYNAKLMLTIEDTGIGIPADKLESIFEPFNQADTSITRQYGGTGLGLSICKSYVELMGGNIEVESEIGKGSIFTLTIPFSLQQTTIVTSP